MTVFYLRAYLPEAPEVNLAEMVPAYGFVTAVAAPIPPETERDAIKQDMLKHFIESGLVTSARAEEVIFDFAD